MTTEELLKQRYKLIATYPHCPHEPGSIYTKKDGMYLREGGGYLNKVNLDQYPHIFKKLEWWEEREIKDLPRFVKYENKISRVRQLNYDNGTWTESGYSGVGLFHLDNQYQLKGFYWNEVEPSTEQEYNDYISKNATP